MIEANNPEIDVDELMQKIQEEVARRESFPSLESSEIIAEPESGAVNVSYMQALLNNAEFKSQIRTHWPEKFNLFPFNLSGWVQRFALKLYNFLLKEQRAVNFSLIEALRESLALNRQLGEQVTALQTQLNGLNASLSATDAHLKATDAHLRTRLDTTDTCLNAAEVRLIATDQRLHELAGHLSATDKRLHEVGVQLNTTEQHMHGVGDRVTMAESQIRETSDRLTATDERHLRNDTFLKNDLAQQKRLIALFLEEARQRLPEPFSQDQVQTFVDEDQHLVDAFYVAFEEQFRGDRDEVVDRLKVYLPLIEEAKVGTPESLILDIGCGRGEWLWLLREAGYTARGIDTNRVMLEECRARELEVIEANVLAYLRTLPDASVGAVTGFHIIEHLPFPVLLKLLNETMRVLKSKGLAIFETPNPQNILVGSNNFYTDPTHFNPLPSLLTKFLLENAGFVQVEVKNLNPYKDSFKVSGSELAERFNDYFYGPQDYAVIGHKL
jgi:O-antigen chain-terminating methyltransferase